MISNSGLFPWIWAEYAQVPRSGAECDAEILNRENKKKYGCIEKSSTTSKMCVREQVMMPWEVASANQQNGSSQGQIMALTV